MGLLRTPTQGKPARHRVPVCRTDKPALIKKNNLLILNNKFQAGTSLWRAGLPRVGVRSAPNPAKRGVPDTAQRLVLGLLRTPTQGKPARHRVPVCRADKPALIKNKNNLLILNNKI
ncbi:hypothetical protein VRC34_05020 [Pseudomonas poae]